MAEFSIPDEELHAFIDGELDEQRAKKVTVALAESPGLSARADRFRHDRQLISDLYTPLADLELPAHLIERLNPQSTAARRVPRRPAMRWGLGIASLAAAGVLIAVWLGNPFIARNDIDGLAAEAIAVRDGRIEGAQKIAVASLPSRDTVNQLLRATIETEANAPDLTKAGYILADIAVYQKQHAVELRYRDREGDLFTVFLRPPAGADRFALREQGARRICIWENSDLSAVMVGEMSSDQMLRVASLAYGDLNF